jgi:hypothetical protein
VRRMDALGLGADTIATALHRLESCAVDLSSGGFGRAALRNTRAILFAGLHEAFSLNSRRCSHMDGEPADRTVTKTIHRFSRDRHVFIKRAYDAEGIRNAPAAIPRHSFWIQHKAEADRGGLDSRPKTKKRLAKKPFAGYQGFSRALI